MDYQLDSWKSKIAPTYAQPEIELVRGQGTRVFDTNGKMYLDFLSGIAVNALGHAHPAVIEAVTKQLSQLGHVSNLVGNPVATKLAEKLLDILDMPNGRIFFCNSGAEANEAAFKYARAHKSGSKMVSLLNGFHGRTTAALSVTGQEEKRKQFEPLLPGVSFLKVNEIPRIKRNISKKVGGVWIEMIQGEAGVVPLSRNFVEAIVQRTKEVDALLIIDEVQTGIGRTGKWFAYQEFDLKPDLVPLAKGLGGGLPIGALGISESNVDLVKAGGHGTTFGGNPVTAAAALAVINTIEQDDLLSNALNMGKLIKDNLQQSSNVLEIRGSGLLLGIVLASDLAKEIEKVALQMGLIVNAVRPNVIRLAPPLNVSREETISAIDILSQAIEKVGSNG
jgi:acetylornithine aminotransferase